MSKQITTLLFLLAFASVANGASLCTRREKPNDLGLSKCSSCWGGILEEATGQCKDSPTPIADCAKYNDDGTECKYCGPGKVFVWEASATETPGHCVDATIPNCVTGRKYIDSERCYICEKSTLPSASRKACVDGTKTVNGPAQDNCEWHSVYHRHSKCSRCKDGFGTSRTVHIEKRFYGAGTEPRIIELNHHYGGKWGKHHDDDDKEDDKKSTCNAFPAGDGSYSWTGCLEYTEVKTTQVIYTRKRYRRRWRWIYRWVRGSTTDEGSTFHCSRCDATKGFHQAQFGGSCQNSNPPPATP